MQKFWSILSALVIGAGAFPMLAQAQASSSSVIGVVETTASDAISIRVSGSTAELNQLAVLAFSTHGRYSVNKSASPKFDIRFSPVGANQVNVQVLQGGTAVFNQTASGTSLRNALLRAADLAVTATCRLPGYFASKLAFVSNRTGKDEIYVGDLFFGEVRQITRDNAHALTPRWSPDGRRILYTSYLKGAPDIYQIDIASMQRTTFAAFNGTNSGARYSPNGQLVAMVLSGSGNPEIFVGNAQGRLSPTRRTQSSAVKSSPCFSPDGSQIVFACEPGPQLYVIPAIGGSPRRVTSGFASYCAEPDWSRGDATKIAFTFAEGRTYQIAVLDLKTGRSQKVSTKGIAFDAVEPSWLADGRHLVYTARGAGSRVLCILDTESGRSTRISGIAAEKGSVWGP